jgi:hypothetical protein
VHSEDWYYGRVLLPFYCLSSDHSYRVSASFEDQCPVRGHPESGNPDIFILWGIRSAWAGMNW